MYGARVGAGRQCRWSVMHIWRDHPGVVIPYTQRRTPTPY
jgi:hypothetical protein